MSVGKIEKLKRDTLLVGIAAEGREEHMYQTCVAWPLVLAIVL
jgi:hypothetical protein